MNGNVDPKRNGHNGHHQNGLLKLILPIDELVRTVRQLDNREAIKSYAQSLAKAIRTDAYDPTRNPDDAHDEDQFQKDNRELPEAEKAAGHAAIIVRDAEHSNATNQSSLVEPKLPLKIVVAAVAALTISIAPTLFDKFFYHFEDKPLGWLFAFAGGALIGLFITWSIVGIMDPSGKRSTVNLVGLIGAIGIGLFCFLLRLSSGEILSAIALTVLEISTVVILECLAGNLRERHRLFSAACEQQMKSAAQLQAHKAELNRRTEEAQEIQARLDDHRNKLAIRTFCAQKPAEIEQAAVDIALKAHHERLAEEEQLPNGATSRQSVYTPHSIRATTATLLLDAGVDIIKVKDLLGHRHITTTQIYDKRRRSTSESASHDVPI